MPIGKARARSARRATRPSPSPSSSRRRTSPGSLHIGHALDNAAGHSRPPCASAGQGCLVGGRHRSCRHRHADGGRAQSLARASSASSSAAKPSSSMCGNGRASRAADHAPAPPPRRLVRLGERALHDGRGLSPSAVGDRCSSSSSARACSIATSAWSIGTRISAPPSPISKSRPRKTTASSGTSPIRSPTERHDLGRHHAPRDDAGRHGGRG
jgi:hypothetical protein